MHRIADPAAIEHEIDTIRCLVAQQIGLLASRDRHGPDRRAADVLLRRLLKRDEDLRQRLMTGAPIAGDRV